MRPVFEERHVLVRQDAADDALVAVAAGHLVARLQLALHRDEDLDHLEHARGEFVAALELFDAIFILRVDPLDRVVILRSEEHTSELPSLMRTSYAVFCLKKKN